MSHGPLTRARTHPSNTRSCVKYTTTYWRRSSSTSRMYTHIHTCIHTHKHTHTQTYTPCRHTYAHTHIHTYTPTHAMPAHTLALSHTFFRYMCEILVFGVVISPTCAHLYTQAHTHAYTHAMLAHVHKHTYTHTHVMPAHTLALSRTFKGTANPTWGDIFESPKLKARTSLSPRFTEKRRSSFEHWALKHFSKISRQVGLSVYLGHPATSLKKKTNYRALLKKMNYKHMASCTSAPHCSIFKRETCSKSSAMRPGRRLGLPSAAFGKSKFVRVASVP